MRGTFKSSGNSLHRQRRLVGGALLLSAWLGILWFLSPGLPVWFGPWASAATKEAGRELFEHEWSPNDPLAQGDGLGPVFNAKSCVACHFQGGVGGGGDLGHNIHNYDVAPTARDPQTHSGTIHVGSTDSSCLESLQLVRQRYPVVRGGARVPNGCSTTAVDFDPVRTVNLQPTALFGAGWIDRISAKAITSSQMTRSVQTTIKEFNLDFASVHPGRVRYLPDGRVGKFGWKAQFATLEEFVAAACANELGLGTPLTEQVKPIARPDAASVTADLDRTQFKQLVAFVDTLPKPVEVLPDDTAGRSVVVRGKELFAGIGCAACHTPDVGGVKGVYSDFLLHTIDDLHAAGSSYAAEAIPDVAPPDDWPKPNEWRSPPLWGVADSGPYLHDGSAKTLRDAIVRHGGDAKVVTEAFNKLPRDDQAAVIAFLGTLKAPPDAVSVGAKGAVAYNGKR
jgi:mono/diheme cytochrome c family protein